MLKKHISAEYALQRIAHQNNTTVDKVRKDIYCAMQVGLCNADHKVQSLWRQVPCAGKVPTPEELIDYLVDRVTHT